MSKEEKEECILKIYRSSKDVYTEVRLCVCRGRREDEEEFTRIYETTDGECLSVSLEAQRFETPVYARFEQFCKELKNRFFCV